jgi:hypothetical protein
VTPNNLELVLYQENSLALVMLDSSNLNTSQLSQASGKSPDNLSLLDDFPLSYDSGVSIATTLVKGILSEFPITQDSLDSVCTTVVTLGLEGCKSIAYIPQTVLDSDSDGAPHLDSDGAPCLDSNVLSKSVEVTTTTDTAPISEYTWERMKELWERRFTHPEKMKPASGYALEGR